MVWRDPERVRAFDRERRAAFRRADPVWGWVVTTLRQAKSRAKRRGISFNLTPRYLVQLCPERCPALGIELIYNGRGLGRPPGTASLDRIIPEFGYVEGNVRVISKRANTIKQDATPGEIIAIGVWAEKARMTVPAEVLNMEPTAPILAGKELTEQPTFWDS